MMLLRKVCNAITEEPPAPNKLMSEQQFWAAENKPGGVIGLYISDIIKVAYRSEPVTVRL